MTTRRAAPALLLVAMAAVLMTSIPGCDVSRGVRPFGRHQAGLVVRDLKVGSGAIAKAGRTLIVNYRMFVDDDPAYEVDGSYDDGQPFEFQLGAGQVIAGWEVGLSGMRVGGERMLTIPPAWAYGARGMPGIIPPNATLVSTVELLDVR